VSETNREHLRPQDETLIRLDDLVVNYPVPHSHLTVHAVSGVSLDIKRGETLGLVGESGCGKSTLGRALLQLPRPTSGSVSYDGVELTRLRDKELQQYRSNLQMIFQDPVASLNPRWSVGKIVSDPLAVQGRGNREQRRDKAAEVLLAVGLDPAQVLERRPHQLSGGQSQRVAIARALVLEPALVVCDEPVSALDVSVQAQILNLLEDMKSRYELSLLFISHDLAVVHNISDRVAVMYLGKLCEVGTPDAIFRHPAHPYTEALIRSIPVPAPGTEPQVDEHLAADLPSPTHPPSGCRFRTRCPLATERCAAEEPRMVRVDDDQFVACHYPLWPQSRVRNPVPVMATSQVEDRQAERLP
jgi:peptide/nickel transport system ATP-binding protein